MLSVCLTFHISSAEPAAEHILLASAVIKLQTCLCLQKVFVRNYILNNEMTNKHLFPEMGDFKGGFDMPPPPYSEVGQVGNIIC